MRLVHLAIAAVEAGPVKVEWGFAVDDNMRTATITYVSLKVNMNACLNFTHGT